MLKMTFHHMLVACNQYCFHRVDASKFLLCQEHFLDQHSTPDWGSLHVPLYIMETHCAMSESWCFLSFLVWEFGKGFLWEKSILDADLLISHFETLRVIKCLCVLLRSWQPPWLAPWCTSLVCMQSGPSSLDERYISQIPKMEDPMKRPLSHHTPPKWTKNCQINEFLNQQIPSVFLKQKSHVELMPSEGDQHDHPCVHGRCQRSLHRSLAEHPHGEVLWSWSTRASVER